jgi:sarcosine oxidase subunit delta
MMRIRCPYCGERPLEEFTYRGDATLRRPDSLDAPAEDAWVDYVYRRDNPAGPLREHWYHGAGCHAWLVLTRDTRTHEIADVAPAVPREPL